MLNDLASIMWLCLISFGDYGGPEGQNTTSSQKTQQHFPKQNISENKLYNIWFYNNNITRFNLSNPPNYNWYIEPCFSNAC